jgi:predicted nucleotidyltransferase
VRAVGNQNHYQANADSPIFEELSGIARKTIGLADPLRDALAPLAGKIRAAFVYGSIAKRTDTAGSDIDVLLLSDEVNYADVFTALEAASSTLARPVNPTILTSAELRKCRENEESFLTRVLAQPKIWLIGAEDALSV